MDVTREDGLLAWQWSNYPPTHRDRRNLLVHALTAPLFPLGWVAVVSALVLGSGWLAVAGVLGVILPIVLQGRTHRLEVRAPAPFQGTLDVVARLFAEQWVTFPRYVLSGGFAQAWRSANPVR